MLNLSLGRWLIWLALVAGFVALVSVDGLWQSVLRDLFPNEREVLHPRAGLSTLVGEHLELVAVSSGLIILIGVPLGIWVTRPSGKDFLPIVTDFTSFGQTFPPIAVLALAIPILGFGRDPTIVALVMYGLLPVVRNTVAGLNNVSRQLLDAAYGVGMSRFQALLYIELPLALPVIVAGVRIAVIINIGTATVGALFGAGGLGSPIVAGMIQDNPAFIVEGAVPAALLAIVADRFFANLEATFAYSPGRSLRT